MAFGEAIDSRRRGYPDVTPQHTGVGMSAIAVFAVELVGTLILAGGAAGAAMAGLLNMADDLVDRGLIGRQR